MGAVASAFAAWVGGEAAATAIATEAAGAGLGVGAAVAPAAASGGLGSSLLSAAGTAVVTAGVEKALTPKPEIPGIKKPVSMPDPLEQQEARRKSITDQLSRSGRASTILSDVSDKLG